MKFTLNIDKTCDEEIIATVHAPSELTERIEALVREYMGQDKLPVYTEDEMKMLPMAQIECIYRELPHLDCGSCGAPNCHALAEDIVKNDAKQSDCLIQLREKQNKG